MKQPKKTRTVFSRLCEAEFHTGLLLERQGNQILTKKTVIFVQELKTERANCVIRDLNRQIPRMERHHTNQMYEAPRTEQV